MSLKWQFYRYSHKLFYNGLPTTPIDFFEQANHIRGPQTNFTVSLRSSNFLLAILKNTLELEQWTNRNQEFLQWTNRKERGPQRNPVDISPICFHLNRVWERNWRHLIRGAFWEFKYQERYLYITRAAHFCPNTWILSRYPVPFTHWRKKFTFFSLFRNNYNRNR